MNREQKAAVIDEVAGELKEAQAVFAVDYRGISVQQAADLRTQLYEADAHFRIVKNRLTQRAVDEAGQEGLKELLIGPTALTFVKGDAALAAKAIATFKREHGVLDFKGGTMEGNVISIDELEALSKLPSRDVLHGQLVGVVAAPLNGLVRGLGSLISGLAIQLGAIRDQGLVSGDAPTESHEQQEGTVTQTVPADESEASAEEASEEAPADETSEAPGDPVAEGEAAEQETDSETETPSEGEEQKEGE